MNCYMVSRELLEQNIKQLKKQAGAVPIWAVIKGDGYGLGALSLAEVLQEQGINHFCITEIREAELLREHGFDTAQILMLRSLADRESIHRLMDLDVILTVGSFDTAKLVNELAGQRSDVARVHLKIDTGMGRYGFLPSQTEQVKELYATCKHLAVEGIYTHFNNAAGDEELTRQEFAAFQAVVSELQTAGLETGTVHCCNSAAFLKYPEMHLCGVRLGSAVLGRMPFRTKLRPVGQAKSEIECLRVLPKGHTTGYGGTWKAKKDTPVAIVPVGWYHGLQLAYRADLCRPSDCFRAAYLALKALLRPQKTMVEIKGKKCPIIGTIGMLHCAVDVSGVDCACGDAVILPIKPLNLKGMEVKFY